MELDDTETLVEESETPTVGEVAPETQADEDQGPVDLDLVDEAETEETESAEDALDVEAEEGEADQAPEVVEVEINGKAFQVPAEIKDNFLMQADYTRKTQELAAEKDTVKTTLEQAHKVLQASQEEINVRAQVAHIDAELKRFESYDFTAYQQDLQNDPLGAPERWAYKQELNQEKAKAEASLSEFANQRSEKAEQDIANRLRETRDFAQKNIKGWSPQVDNKVMEFVTQTLQRPVEEIRNAMNPTVYQTLYLAMIGHQSLTRQAAAKPQMGQPSKPIKPLNKVSSASPGAVHKDPADMSMEEYDKWASAKFKD